MAAAVLGRRFRPEALDAVAGGDGPSRGSGSMGSCAASCSRGRRPRLARRGRARLRAGPRARGRVSDAGADRAARPAPGGRAVLRLARRRTSPESLAGHLVEAHRLAPQPRRGAHRAIARSPRCASPPAARSRFTSRHARSSPSRARCGLADDTERATCSPKRPTPRRAAGRLERAAALPARAGRAPGRAPATRAERPARAPGWPACSSRRRRTSRRSTELETAISGHPSTGADAAGIELAAQLARARTVLGDDAEPALGGPCPGRGAAPGPRAVATDLLITRGDRALPRSARRRPGWPTCARRSARPRTAGCCTPSCAPGTTWPGGCSATIRARRWRRHARDSSWPSRWGSATWPCRWRTWPARPPSTRADWDWALATVADLADQGIRGLPARPERGRRGDSRPARRAGARRRPRTARAAAAGAPIRRSWPSCDWRARGPRSSTRTSMRPAGSPSRRSRSPEPATATSWPSPSGPALAGGSRTRPRRRWPT